MSLAALAAHATRHKQEDHFRAASEFPGAQSAEQSALASAPPSICFSLSPIKPENAGSRVKGGHRDLPSKAGRLLDSNTVQAMMVLPIPATLMRELHVRTGCHSPAESMSLALNRAQLSMQHQSSATTSGGPRNRAKMLLLTADNLQLGS
ncbi:hypothetical protein M441DRAFT_47169 [Trichoderma asperellum CBS 433.97]|uniref:Uncharacterized protein n=1 Tax=Trichoderma asperellum (strain ATCC 204424 / CBS 433.97 / NBRC 101777) TaxID=1042311 RepID=A0A2T3Z752_TRIA4|nr:hypothetical protein M441DRAFT_47169 [Trichoderma asperellum CBS 433.97]PTB40639.1 hypothetical protein M441DRAFT_47169 [Trichoderma asperellum CBS 433.97]